MEVIAVYIAALKGIKKPEVEFVSNQVIRLKGERVYRYTRQRIEWHKDQGHKVIFISGSPDFLVSKMAKKYGATDFYGSVYHVDHENKFNGEITAMWDSQSKKKAIDHFVRKHHLDLRKSYAYGDTNGDMGMFEKVGHPVAINPAKEFIHSILNNKELAKKTKIIVERKDVIYKLNTDFEIM
jgi:HAD superfamily hydrolase (TIGR01490 family)